MMVIRLMGVVVVVRRLVVLVEGGLVFIFFAGAFGDGPGGFDILQSSLLHLKIKTICIRIFVNYTHETFSKYKLKLMYVF